MRRVDDLKPSPRNVRTHADEQVELLVNSMERFGLTNPAIVDDSDHVVAGHARLEAAKRMGLKWFPVIRLSDLSEAELRAYVSARQQADRHHYLGHPARTHAGSYRISDGRPV